ncbi:MAG: phosphodiester glycosidase family protein [Oscillospiraceae bacterium]
MQRRKFTRTALIALVLSFTLVSGALAAVLGELINGHETFLGAGMELSKGVYWTGSDYRTENYIEYTPTSDVRPVVVSGSKLCNYGNFSSMASLLEKQGKHVIAGINGDYFVVANYEPLGIVVQDGELLSSDAGHWAVGFQDDGNAVFGAPKLDISVQLAGNSFLLNAVNKTRRSGEAVLYTDDYSAATKNKGAGTDIICSIDGPIGMNSSRTLTVEQIVTTGGAVTIPAGKAVLSVSAEAWEGLKTAVAAITPGTTIPLKITAPAEWANVKYAIGSLYKLVENGAVVKNADSSAAPRSAVGKKADGTLVLYTMDGRQTGHSVGVTMEMLSRRMIELGCTDAAIMDGGGSTSMNAIYLGDSSASQINNPSDGYQRSVTNYIMLITEKAPTGKADRLALYPLTTHVLSGASSSFVIKAADQNGYATAPDRPVTMAVSDGLGTIAADGTFVSTGAGSGTLTATADGLVSAAVQITVVGTPDSVTVKNEANGKSISALSVASGSVTKLTALAEKNHVDLISQDKCYTWAVSGNIGTVNADGTFTAGKDTASGSISVTAGGKTVSIPVSVTNPERFDDVNPSDWFYNPVKQISDAGLMAGTADRIFSPNQPTSRAMAVTVLHRRAGSPEPSKASGFSDVPANEWYTKAVYWAEEKGVVQGSNGKFDPNSAITREQLAAIIYRYSGSPATNGNLNAFTDAAAVSSWAKQSMCWAVENGLISGITPSGIYPYETATRAQVAAIITRMK